MILISTFIAPPGAPQVAALKLPLPSATAWLDPVDRQIVALVREHGPVKTWTLINRVAENESAHNRTDGRNIRLAILDKITRLKRLKIIHGVGRNEIAAAKPVRHPARRRRKRRIASVGGFGREGAVSGINQSDQTKQPQIDYPVGDQIDAKSSLPNSQMSNTAQIESDFSPEQLTVAARALAILPRQKPKKLKGLFNGRRYARGQPIILPDGRRAYLWGLRRRRVVWSMNPKILLFSVRGAWVDWGVFPESLVELEKNAAAVVLGQAKRGVRERPSALKAETARINGCAPVRPGSRPRGRPHNIRNCLH